VLIDRTIVNFSTVGEAMLRPLTILIMVMSTSVYAADITEHEFDGRHVIRIGGEFVLDDHKKFKELALHYDDGEALVMFADSPGGALVAALQIGKTIMIKEFDTSVAAYSSCASACAFAWLSGRQRYLEDQARVGFHAAYNYDASGNTSISGQGNAVLGAYLNRLNLSTEALLYVTEAGPSDMRWLDVENANKVGIFTRAGNTKTAAVEPPAPVEKQQRRQFRKQYYERLRPSADEPIPIPQEPISPPPSRTDGDGWRTLTQTDFYGYDIRAGLITQDAKTCEAQCRVNGECKAYTFNIEKRACFIKSQIGLAYRNPAAVSGHRERRVFPTSYFVLMEGIDFPGGDYGRHPDVTLEKCDELCGWAGPYCQGYTYVKFNKTCWLKDNRIGKPIPNKFVISARRQP
jgi:hypothetical protein